MKTRRKVRTKGRTEILGVFRADDGTKIVTAPRRIFIDCACCAAETALDEAEAVCTDTLVCPACFQSQYEE